MTPRTILGVFAHPDDESMGPGGTLAKYAAAGHRVAFVTATEGGAGRLHEERPEDDAGREKLRSIRRDETRTAAGVLGIESLGFLGWPDGGMASRNVLELEEIVVGYLRREKPDVVVTLHGSGLSYHPDHRVLTLAVMGAFLGSGEATWYASEELRELAPHSPSRLYAFSADREADYWKGFPRRVYGSSPDEISAVIDTRDTADTKWKAIEAHASQQNGPPFRVLYEAGAFLEEHFVRVFPTPRPGEPLEKDLLEGL